MNKTFFYFFTLFFIQLGITCSVFAQADACASATVLSVNSSCSNTAYTLQSVFTTDAPANLCVSGAQNVEDGWFTFTATSTQTAIRLTNSLANSDVALIVFSGMCGSLTQVACANVNGTSAGEVLSLTTVNATTYRVAVVRVNNGTTTGNITGNICVFNAPTNDNPCGATALTVGTSCALVNSTKCEL
jgi:hypothetical protein